MSYFSLLTDNLSEPNVDPGKDDEGEGGVCQHYYAALNNDYPIAEWGGAID